MPEVKDIHCVSICADYRGNRFYTTPGYTQEKMQDMVNKIFILNVSVGKQSRQHTRFATQDWGIIWKEEIIPNPLIIGGRPCNALFVDWEIENGS